MELAVEVVGDGTRTVEVPDDATYGDLVAPLSVSVHAVAVQVDGRTVPADEPVGDGVDHVRVVRLVTGG